MSGLFPSSMLVMLALGVTVAALGLVLSKTIPPWLLNQFDEEPEQADAEPPVALPAIPTRWLDAVLGLLLAGLSVWLLRTWGLGLRSFSLMFFCLLTLTLAHIDTRTGLLPDVLTLPLLVAGLTLHSVSGWSAAATAFAGAALGYGLLRVVFSLYYWKTGRAGMGQGDFKLAAALGAWLGVQTVPVLLLLSSVAGVIVGLGALMLKRLPQGAAIPFGPFLAVAGILLLLWGQ